MFEEYKDVLTADEVCKALRIGRNSLYELFKSGELEFIRIGVKYIIPKEFLMNFVNANKQKGFQSSRDRV